MTADEQKSLCDAVIARTAQTLVNEVGVPVEVLLDRLLTFAGAHAVVRQGTAGAAESFRKCADNIDAGCFRSITVGERLN